MAWTTGSLSSGSQNPFQTCGVPFSSSITSTTATLSSSYSSTSSVMGMGFSQPTVSSVPVISLTGSSHSQASVSQELYDKILTIVHQEIARVQSQSTPTSSTLLAASDGPLSSVTASSTFTSPTFTSPSLLYLKQAHNRNYLWITLAMLNLFLSFLSWESKWTDPS